VLELATVDNVDMYISGGRQIAECDTEHACWERFKQTCSLSLFDCSFVGLLGDILLLDFPS
jgi:hypothetical protein